MSGLFGPANDLTDECGVNRWLMLRVDGAVFKNVCYFPGMSAHSCNLLLKQGKKN
jgi:hypothetical protein